MSFGDEDTVGQEMYTGGDTSVEDLNLDQELANRVDFLINQAVENPTGLLEMAGFTSERVRNVLGLQGLVALGIAGAMFAGKKSGFVMQETPTGEAGVYWFLANAVAAQVTALGWAAGEYIKQTRSGEQVKTPAELLESQYQDHSAGGAHLGEFGVAPEEMTIYDGEIEVHKTQLAEEYQGLSGQIKLIKTVVGALFNNIPKDN